MYPSILPFNSRQTTQMLILDDRTHGIPTSKIPPPSIFPSAPVSHSPTMPSPRQPPRTIPSSTSTPPPQPLRNPPNKGNRILILGHLPLMLLTVVDRPLNMIRVRRVLRHRQQVRLPVVLHQDWAPQRFISSSSSSNRGWRRRRRCRLLRSRPVGI